MTTLVPWLRKTGGIPGHAGKDSIAHILWLKHERPDIYHAAYKFLEPKDYLNQKLTGKFAAGFDSIILHWVTDNRRIAEIDYDAQLLKLAGVAREKLPDLKPATAILGTLAPHIAREFGLRDDVRVVMGTPDVQSAAIGSGAVRDFESHLYVGTSAWLCCHVPFKKTDLSHNMASLPSALPNRYLLTNEQESAGACLAFLRDNLFFAQDELNTPLPEHAYRAFDALAARVPAGSDNLIFTPWLYGERTPIEDHRVRGGFFNLSLQTTRAHMLRAVMEGVAYNARWLLDAVEQFCGRPMHALNFIGGGANSEVWSQIFADVLNRPIRQVQDPVQANVRGVALLAAVALGVMRADEIPAHVAIAQTFAPKTENRKLYDELFGEFKNIYRANQKIYARLNRNVA
jgi:xylulokinase